VFDSFRVQQVGGMFDVPLAERASQQFKVDVPDWLLGKASEGNCNLPSPSGRGAGGEGCSVKSLSQREFAIRPSP
jgi:hypothetical protein